MGSAILFAFAIAGAQPSQVDSFLVFREILSQINVIESIKNPDSLGRRLVKLHEKDSEKFKLYTSVMLQDEHRVWKYSISGDDCTMPFSTVLYRSLESQNLIAWDSVSRGMSPLFFNENVWREGDRGYLYQQRYARKLREIDPDWMPGSIYIPMSCASYAGGLMTLENGSQFWPSQLEVARLKALIKTGASRDELIKSVDSLCQIGRSLYAMPLEVKYIYRPLKFRIPLLLKMMRQRTAKDIADIRQLFLLNKDSIAESAFLGMINAGQKMDLPGAPDIVEDEFVRIRKDYLFSQGFCVDGSQNRMALNIFSRRYPKWIERPICEK